MAHHPSFTSPELAYQYIQANNMAALKAAYISSHFTWAEYLVHRTPKELSGIQLVHLHALQSLAHHLEAVRIQLGGVPVTITSGWRDRQSNQEAGGKPNSQHLLGKAADIVVQGHTPAKVQRILGANWPGGMGYGKDFTHLDIRPYKARFHYR
jgi:hypothetical protein